VFFLHRVAFLFECFVLELHSNVMLFNECIFSCRRVIILSWVKELMEKESSEF